MHRLNTSFVLGYHGCSAEIGEKLLAGEPFSASDNDYDWLGPGVYFWQSNPLRALQFAEEKKRREAARWSVSIVGAIIDPGRCLDLSTKAGIDQVRGAHTEFIATLGAARVSPPTNSGGNDLFLRKLDCAVIRSVHDIRAAAGDEPIDTVFGVFVEGNRLYEDAGFFEKTHIQICVRTPAMIHGVFRVPEADLV